jgi:hypothetical protein
LRLADRQGLLTGQLNEAQSVGLQILMMLDAGERAETFWRTFRAMLGAASPKMLPDLFPEVFAQRDPAVSEAEAIDRQALGEDGQRDLDRVDQSQITWAVPASDEERAAVDALIAASTASTHIVTAKELQGGEWI